MTTTEIGRLGEKHAAKFLKKNGYRILEKNLHQSHNEIDMIVKNKTYIVFVEVKARTVDEDLFSAYGSPAVAVNKAKQQRTITAAKAYLASGIASQLQPRFDVVEIYLSKQHHKLLHINHMIDAFWA